MQYSVRLTNERGFQWHGRSNLWVKGIVFTNGKLIELPSLLALLEESKSTPIESLRELIGLQGNFVIVRANESSVDVLCDSIRSFPIYYQTARNTCIVTDVIPCDNDSSFQKESISEYLTAGYVTGSRTLYQGWSQVRAGEALTLSYDSLTGFESVSHVRSGFSRDTTTKYTENDKLENIETAFDAVANRIAEVANGKSVVIPLSGGFDSRLIAVMCKKVGLKNVTAFSYGSKGNHESKVSKHVASALGIPWKFVEYNPEKWMKIIGNRELFNYCRGGGSLPHVQDMIAINELKRTGEIDEGSIVLPGHSGDFVGGSHIPMHVRFTRKMSRQEVISHLIRKHFSLDPLLIENRRVEIEAVLSNQIISQSRLFAPEIVRCIEEWDLSERQAKYIVNSVRGYEYCDLKWYCPLYDDALLLALKTLGIKDAIDTYIYRKAVSNYCESLLGDGFSYGNKRPAFWECIPFYLVEHLSLRNLFPKPDTSKFMGCPLIGGEGRSFLGELARYDITKHIECVGATGVDCDISLVSSGMEISNNNNDKVNSK